MPAFFCTLNLPFFYGFRFLRASKPGQLSFSSQRYFEKYRSGGNLHFQTNAMYNKCIRRLLLFMRPRRIYALLFDFLFLNMYAHTRGAILRNAGAFAVFPHRQRGVFFDLPTGPASFTAYQSAFITQHSEFFLGSRSFLRPRCFTFSDDVFFPKKLLWQTGQRTSPRLLPTTQTPQKLLETLLTNTNTVRIDTYRIDTWRLLDFSYWTVLQTTHNVF